MRILKDMLVSDFFYVVLKLIFNVLCMLTLFVVPSTLVVGQSKPFVIELGTFKKIDLMNVTNTYANAGTLCSFDKDTIYETEYFNSISSLSVVNKVPSLRDNESYLDLAIVYPFVETTNLLNLTRLPLAFGEPNVWGYATMEQIDAHRAMWENFVVKFSERVWLIDLTYSRCSVLARELISKFRNLRELRLPFEGLNFACENIQFPLTLERLIVFNSRIDSSFAKSVGDLKFLKEITFVGCWLDEETILPLLAKCPSRKSGNLDVSNGLINLRNISLSLESIRYIDCDYRMPLIMEGFDWPLLSELLHARSFQVSEANDLVFLNLFFSMTMENIPRLRKLSILRYNMEEVRTFKKENGNLFDISRKDAIIRTLEAYSSEQDIDFRIKSTEQDQP